MEQEKRDAERRDFDAATVTANEARGRRDYDAAVQAFKAFLVQHPDSGVAADAAANVERFESEIKGIYEGVAAGAAKYVETSQFGQAAASVARFLESYTSVQWAAEAQKLRDQIAQATDAAFEAEHKKVLASLLAMSHADAYAQYGLLESRFRGTRWSDYARARLAEVEAERKFFREFVSRVAASAKAPKESPFVPPDAPRVLATERWFVAGADERQMVLATGKHNPIQQSVPWTKILPQQQMAVLSLFFPAPAPEESAVMDYLRRERGLPPEGAVPAP
jgi:hypothetical protein